MIFEYKVRAKHKLGYKEFIFYADTDIEEFLNRNDIKYVRNITDTIEHKQKQEIERLKEDNKELGRLYSRANNEFLKLHSIIKEAREKLIKYGLVDKDNNFNAYLDTIELKELLEILDKENKE